MNTNKINSVSHGVLVCILLFISYVLLMLGNSAVSLTHPDEVFYVQTAKEMMAHHDYLTPYIFDVPQFEKPILFYWLLIIAFKVFGLTAFAARFWPAAFGILGVLATYWLGVMLFGNKRAAFLSGAILATSFIYLTLSRSALTDMVFSIWVVLSLFCFYFGYHQKKYKTHGIILSFVCSAAAVLTKGVLGIVFSMGVIIIFLLMRKEWAFLKSPATLIGFLLFLLLAVPWHVLMFKLYGQEFIREYWNNVHVRRILEAEHQKSNTWYFYPGTMFAGVLPWSFFLIPALGKVFQCFKNEKASGNPFPFLILWIGVVFGVMQIAQSKLASYIFAVFPAIALILGYYWDQALDETQKKREPRSLKLISYGMAVVLFFAAVGSIVYAKRNVELIVHLGPIYVFSVLSACCAVAVFFFTFKKEYTKTFISLASVTLVVLIFLFLGRTYAEPWVSCKEISETLKRIDSSNSTVLCSKILVRAVRFYTDRKTAVLDINGSGFFSPHPIPFLTSDEKVRNFLQTQPATFCIVKKSGMKDLERIAQEKSYTLEIIEMSGDKYLLKIERTKLNNG